MNSNPRKALSIEENLRNVNHAQVSYSLNKQTYSPKTFIRNGQELYIFTLKALS